MKKGLRSERSVIRSTGRRKVIRAPLFATLYTGQREKRSLGLAIFQEGVERTLVNEQVGDPFLEGSELPFSL